MMAGQLQTLLSVGDYFQPQVGHVSEYDEVTQNLLMALKERVWLHRKYLLVASIRWFCPFGPMNTTIKHKGNTHQLCWTKKRLLESALLPWRSGPACLERLLMLRAVHVHNRKTSEGVLR